MFEQDRLPGPDGGDQILGAPGAQRGDVATLPRRGAAGPGGGLRRHVCRGRLDGRRLVAEQLIDVTLRAQGDRHVRIRG